MSPKKQVTATEATNSVEESQEQSYEQALERLEEILAKLETGDLALEKSLKLFEEGVGLSRFCLQKLDAAEGRLEILLGFDGDQPRLDAFTTNNEVE